MNKNFLLIGRGIFTIFVIVALGLIIINEKKEELLSPKVEQKLNEYFDNNYSSINLTKSKMTFDNKTFTIKLSSPKNKNHFFYIKYKNKKIEDTYKEDYVEGRNILKYTTDIIKSDIKYITNIDCNIKEVSTLDKFTTKVQERIIGEDNLIELKYYYIEKELNIDNWDSEDITNEIIKLIDTMRINDITPKYYKIIINDKNDITNSYEINNLDESFIKNANNKAIINDIINDNNSELLKENKITYKKLN